LAKDISLLEVIDVLSKIEMLDCLGNKNNCINWSECLVRDLWDDFYKSIYRTFGNKTLKTIISRRSANA